jgi:hypothetical protein
MHLQQRGSSTDSATFEPRACDMAVLSRGQSSRCLQPAVVSNNSAGRRLLAVGSTSLRSQGIGTKEIVSQCGEKR